MTARRTKDHSEHLQKHKTKALLRMVSSKEPLTIKETQNLECAYHAGDDMAALFLAANASTDPSTKAVAEEWIYQAMESKDKEVCACAALSLADLIMDEQRPHFQYDISRIVSLLEFAYQKGSLPAAEELALLHIEHKVKLGDANEELAMGWKWIVRSKPWPLRLVLSFWPLTLMPQFVIKALVAPVGSRKRIREHVAECHRELSIERSEIEGK